MVVCFWVLIFVSVMFVVVLCGCLGIRRLWGLDIGCCGLVYFRVC